VSTLDKDKFDTDFLTPWYEPWRYNADKHFAHKFSQLFSELEEEMIRYRSECPLGVYLLLEQPESGWSIELRQCHPIVSRFGNWRQNAHAN